jgi:hypothetical protein
MVQQQKRSMSAVVSLMVLAIVVLGSATARAESKVPETAAEHLALAKHYQEKATEYRAEAQTHKDMAAAYKKAALSSHAVAQGGSDPKLTKAIAHCNAIAATAEKLASENQKAADYHTLRAKEMEGK